MKLTKLGYSNRSSKLIGQNMMGTVIESQFAYLIVGDTLW